MPREFDLLGHPIPDNHGQPGANGHVATAKNVSKIRLLLVAGMTKKAIAAELGLSVPTLNKHYFTSQEKSLRSARAQAICDAKAANLLRLHQASEKGNVAAIKEMNAILSAEAMKDRVKDAVESPGDTKPSPSRRKVAGKKAQQVDAARAAIAQNDLLDPTVH